MKLIKTLLLFGIVIIASSCASKYPLKVNIDDYKKGLEITNSIVLTKNLFKDKCIELDSKIPATQQLQRQVDDEILYTFENRALLKNYNLNNNCHTDNSIKITKIKTKYSWDGMMRLNIYRGDVSLESTYYCNNETMTFASTKESKLKKHGKMIALGVVGKKKTKAMIAAVVVLAFDDAVSDIYDQINMQCNQ